MIDAPVKERIVKKNCYEVGDEIKLKSREFLADLPIDTFYGGTLDNADKVGVVKKIIHGMYNRVMVNWYEVELSDGTHSIWAHPTILGALVK